MGIRDLIRRFLAGRNFDLQRVPAPLLARPDARLLPSYDLIVPYLMQHVQDVIFVQVGANDGQRADPIHDLIAKYGWRGILVEPQKDMFTALKENYKGVPGLVFENAAVADQDGSREFYRIRPDATLPPFANGLASFRREVIYRHQHRIPDLDSRIVVEQVPCFTLSTLLSRAGFDRIDVLQIDVEGYDAEVVKMVDFKRIKPWIICYEWVHLSRGDQNACVQRLIDNGYALTPIGMDMMAMRRPA